ncbi:MAG: hypothetical protein B7X93_03600 [Hydrogenophilales bacterium 17-61-9]|nr:MAG: hypothetical protein B7X93_03600 [Hydrogenophilales bacterium 17-61-9]
MNAMRLHHRQTGAVAIMTAFAIVLLIAMIGLVVDLGYLYTRKTELQNAADAAALAGARELNGTTAGVTAAAAQAIALAAANSSDLDATPVAIANANIEFGPLPSGPWSSVAAATAAPTDKYFIKVDTRGILQGSRPTWFMGVISAGLANTNTFGMAVAGRTVCEGLPVFTCVRPGGGAPDYGFVKGTSYRLAPSESTPPNVGPGNIGWMDPVPPGAPGLISGANDMREILCRGQTYCIAVGTYTSLTQPAFNPMMDALNTRFGVYQGTLNDAVHKQACPADTNVKEYPYGAAAGSGSPVDWLAVTPLDKQGLAGSETVVAGSPKIVHWAAVRPAAGDTPAVSGGYPATGTPYGQSATSGSPQYHQSPPSTLGGDSVASQAGRRIVTLGIASNCPSLVGSGDPVNIVAFGRFLMQLQGVGNGPNKGFHGEFIDTVPTPPVMLPEIKLYR